MYCYDIFSDLKSIEKNIQKKSWDFDGMIFLIKKIYHKCPCGGWGELISKEDFLNKFKGVDDGETRRV